MIFSFLRGVIVAIALSLALLFTQVFPKTFPLATALVGPVWQLFVGNRLEAFSTSWTAGRSHPDSSDDGACKPLWVDHARNDMALQCYATQNVARLCDPAERAHFGWLVAQYLVDERIFNQTLLAAIPIVALGGAGVKDYDPTTPHNNPALVAYAQKLKEQGFEKAMRLPVLSDSEITTLLQNLASKGYIHRGDLPWGLPPRLEKSFSESDPPGLPTNCAG